MIKLKYYAKKKEEKISNKILLIYFFTVNFTVLDEEAL